MKRFLLALLLVIAPVPTYAGDLIDKLQEVSVTVTTGRGSGSGVLSTRKIGDDNVTFVLTAAHVVEGLRKTRQIIDGKSGTPRTVVEFDDAQIVQSINEDGRLVARYSILASVIRYNREEDLAILKVRKKNFSTASFRIYNEKKLPSLGDDVINVGSALGLDGSNTVSKGIVSQHGRLLDGHVYDQVSCPGFPGCSGSGLFLNDGRMLGILTNGAGETFILCVPARRILDWAKSANVEWAINSECPLPSEPDLKKIPIEDNGVNFAVPYEAAKTTPKHSFKNFFLKENISAYLRSL